MRWCRRHMRTCESFCMYLCVQHKHVNLHCKSTYEGIIEWKPLWMAYSILVEITKLMSRKDAKFGIKFYEWMEDVMRFPDIFLVIWGMVCPFRIRHLNMRPQSALLIITFPRQEICRQLMEPSTFYTLADYCLTKWFQNNLNSTK